MKVLTALVVGFSLFVHAEKGGEGPSSAHTSPPECQKYFAQSNIRRELAVLENPVRSELQLFNRTFNDPEIKAQIQEKIEDTFQEMLPFLNDAYDNSSQLNALLQGRIERTVKMAKQIVMETLSADALSQRLHGLIDQTNKDTAVLSNSKRKIFGLFTVSSSASPESVLDAIINLRRFEELGDKEITNINNAELHLNEQAKVNRAMGVVLQAESAFLTGLSSRIQSAYRSESDEKTFVQGQIELKKNLVEAQRAFIEANALIVRSAIAAITTQREQIQQVQGQIPFFKTSYPTQFAKAEEVIQNEIAEAHAQQKRIEAENEKNQKELARKQAEDQRKLELETQQKIEAEAQRLADIKFSEEIFNQYEPEVSSEIRTLLDNTIYNPLGIQLGSFADFLKSLKNRNLSIADYVHFLFRFPRGKGGHEESFLSLWTELSNAYKISVPDLGKTAFPDFIVGLYALSQNPVSIQDPKLVRFFRLQLKELFETSKETKHWRENSADKLKNFQRAYNELVDKAIFSPLKVEQEKKKAKALAEEKRNEELMANVEKYLSEKDQHISLFIRELAQNFENLSDTDAMSHVYNQFLKNPHITISPEEGAYLLLQMPENSGAYSKNVKMNNWLTGTYIKQEGLKDYEHTGILIYEAEIALTILARIDQIPVNKEIQKFLNTQVLRRIEKSFIKDRYHDSYMQHVRVLVARFSQSPPGINIKKEKVAKERQEAQEKSKKEQQQQQARSEIERYSNFAKTFEDQIPNELKLLFYRIKTQPGDTDLLPIKKYVNETPITKWTLAQTIYILEHLPRGVKSGFSSPGTEYSSHEIMKHFGLTVYNFKQHFFHYDIDIAAQVVFRLTETPQDIALIEYLRYQLKKIFDESRFFIAYKDNAEMVNNFKKIPERVIFEPRGKVDLEAYLKKETLEKNESLLREKILQDAQSDISDTVRTLFDLPMEKLSRLKSLQALVKSEHPFTTGDALFIILNLPRETKYATTSILNPILKKYGFSAVESGNNVFFDYSILIYLLPKIARPQSLSALKYLREQIQKQILGVGLDPTSEWSAKIQRIIDLSIAEISRTPSEEARTTESDSTQVQP